MTVAKLRDLLSLLPDELPVFIDAGALRVYDVTLVPAMAAGRQYVELARVGVQQDVLRALRR